MLNYTETVKKVEEHHSGGRIVFRVQDRDGRGPWRPGFSDQWVEDREDFDNLVPWYREMGDVHKLGDPGSHKGTGCATVEQLRRWFTESEYRKLKGFGYQAVELWADRILGESDIQLVFERYHLPCRIGAKVFDLYPEHNE